MRKFLTTLFLSVVCALSAQAQVEQVKNTNPHILYKNPMTGEEILKISVMHKVAEYKQPEIYKLWWNEVQKCMGMPIVLSEELKSGVHFMQVAGRHFAIDNVPVFFWGYTAYWNDTIYMAERRVLDQRVVKHEMAHYVMWHNGLEAGHPDDIFKRCGLT